MLILCSNGLTSEKLLSCVRDKVQGHTTAALVVTADNEYKEKNYHVPRCVKELETLGLLVDIFDLDKQSADELLHYDIVEFIGGNPFYLLQTIHKSNSANILKEIAANKVLVGWSAAAIVFGPTLELVNMYSPEMNFMGLKNLKALGLTKVEVLPHYNKFVDRFEKFEEKCKDYEKKNHVQVFRLNDGDGVCIEGDRISVLR